MIVLKLFYNIISEGSYFLQWIFVLDMLDSLF